MNTYWRTKFAWSFSRHNLWLECRRRWWYQYIGCWDAGPEKDEIWRLKRLTNRYFFPGNVVHGMIAGVFKSFLRGVEPDGAAVIKQADFLLAQPDPKQFIETENGVGLSRQDIAMMRQVGSQCLSNFFKILPRYLSMQVRGIEESIEFRVDDTPVTAKLDLACETEDGMILVTDWKTGKDDPGEARTSDQMTNYIHAKATTTSLEVIGEYAYLKTGSIYPAARTAKDVDRLRNLIRTSSALMLKPSADEDFVAEPEKGARTCLGCNYLRICKSAQR